MFRPGGFVITSTLRWWGRSVRRARRSWPPTGARSGRTSVGGPPPTRRGACAAAGLHGLSAGDLPAVRWSAGYARSLHGLCGSCGPCGSGDDGESLVRLACPDCSPGTPEAKTRAHLASGHTATGADLR